MVLIIDNYDSFTYNIYQYVLQLDYEVVVFRNDKITIAEIEKMNPASIIISPGPGRPESAGISIEAVRHFMGKIPILGICLGLQSIGIAFGAQVVASKKLYHGKESEISHDGKGIFSGIKNPFTAIRYHSLVLQEISLPNDLQVSATSEDNEIMAVRHNKYRVIGVQFHPESIGTDYGYKLLDNFLNHQPEEKITITAIKKLQQGQALTTDEAERTMDEITSGEASQAQIASLLTALSIKGATVEELTGFVRIMRKKALPVEKPAGVEVIDTCGTGGDGKQTFNISTVAAIIAAGAGTCVAKHGNRSVTSRCGSADILEALGVNISASPERMGHTIKGCGIGFLFAPRLHASMKHAAPVRREIGIRTVFNILGPMCNPAQADYQIVGVFDKDLTETVAGVLNNLGIRRAMVVHGCDGLDEITLTSKTKVSELKDGWIKNYFFDPRDFQFDYCSPADLKGGSLKTNTEIALAILDGEQGPKRDIAVLNAAAAIYLFKHPIGFKEAIIMAQESLDTGAAKNKLEELITFSSM